MQEFKILPSWIEQMSADQKFSSPVDEKCCMKELIGLPAVLLPQRDETKILGNLRLYPVVVIGSYSSNIRWLSGGWWFWVCRNYEKNLCFFLLYFVSNLKCPYFWIMNTNLRKEYCLTFVLRLFKKVFKLFLTYF